MAAIVVLSFVDVFIPNEIAGDRGQDSRGKYMMEQRQAEEVLRSHKGESQRHWLECVEYQEILCLDFVDSTK